MVVSRKQSGDPDVSVRTETRLPLRVLRRLDHERLRAEYRRASVNRPPALEIFSDDRVPLPDPLNGNLPPAEIYNLHWVVGLIDSSRFFARLDPAMPLVWTLHDMNPFTGGCHYAMGCERFTEACGACPQLGSNSDDDFSARIYRRKANALANRATLTTRIVALSRWLQGEASRSGLLGRFQVDRIPNGLDTDVFTPRARATARDVFGLPPRGKVVLFVADSVVNQRKGFDLLQEALYGLPADRPVTLAAIGAGADAAFGGCDIVGLGRIDNERLMSFAYSAADLFVLPTRADNLPNVVLESMACGTPVVAFDVGGVPDMVRPGETGLLAAPEDVAALREAIVTLLDDNGLRARLAHNCRQVAVNEYALGIQARRYTALYEELIGASAKLRRKGQAQTLS